MSSAANLGLTIAGGEALAAKLRTLGGGVRKRALVKVLRVAAVPIQGRAAELAPYDPRTNIHLKDSIGISVVPTTGQPWTISASDDYQAAVAIGPTKHAFWGLFVEYGYGPGVRRAEPFMRPAFDEGADRALTLISEGLWQLIEAANSGTGVFDTGDAT